MYSLIILYKLLVNLDNISGNCFLSNCGNSVRIVKSYVWRHGLFGDRTHDRHVVKSYELTTVLRDRLSYHQQF